MYDYMDRGTSNATSMAERASVWVVKNVYDANRGEIDGYGAGLTDMFGVRARVPEFITRLQADRESKRGDGSI